MSKNFESWVFDYKMFLFGPIYINFELAIAELYDKSHYMSKFYMRLITIAHS